MRALYCRAVWFVSGVWHRCRRRRCCDACGRWFGLPVKYWTAGEPLCSIECVANSQPIGRGARAVAMVSEIRRQAHNKTDCSH